MHRAILYFLLIMMLLFGSSQKPEGAGQRLLREAQVRFDSAQYTTALQLGQEALEHSPAGETDAGECLLLLGDVFLETGEWEAARQQFQAALDIFTRKRGADDRQTADALNRLGEYHNRKNEFSLAETYFKKALHIRESALGPVHEKVADSYNNLGNCAVGKGQYAVGAVLHQKALDIRRQVLPPGHPDLATSFNNLGNCAYLSGNYPESLTFFEQALLIRSNQFGNQHPKTAQVLNNLGNACAALGRTHEAIQYYRQALEIRRKHFGDRHPTVAGVLENIANLYFDQGDYLAALDFFRQAHAVQRAVQGETSASAASLWHSIGLCYQFEGDFDRALEHHLTAAPVLEATFGGAHPAVGSLFNNLGNCYAGKNDFTRALSAYGRALQVFLAVKPSPVAEIALVYNNLGDANLENGLPGEALAFFEKAIKTNGPQAIYLKNKSLALIQLQRWPEASALMALAIKNSPATDAMAATEMLDAWGTMLCKRGLQTNDSALLRQSIGVFEQSRRQADSMQAQLGSAGSRQRWLEMQFPAHASALEACYALWQKTGEKALLEQAFALAERNKSIQLLDQLRKEQAEQVAGIPDSLLEQERRWQEALNLREKVLLTYRQAENTAEARAAESAVATARQALAALRQSFEKDYPGYYRLRYGRQTAGSVMVQQQLLRKDQAMLEYFVADSAVFVFVITAADFRCLRLARHFSLDTWVSTMRGSLQGYPTAAAAAANSLAKAYTESAQQLYEAIFAPVERAVSLPKNLVIVPDGTLAYLPFECLLRTRPADENQFKSHAYLLRDYCIGYAYSASQQWALQQTLTPDLPENLLAVAPVYENHHFGLGPLLNNRAEAKSMHDMLGGKLLDGAAATMPAFLAEAGKYRILLLSMHGKASSTVGDMSYVAFSTGAHTTENPFLYARDLYARPIPAELVVLSACETSVGSYRFGQGVISLAKGFFQAGARSVAATLWSVDDAKNAELMRLFFHEIKNGLPKDEALQRAKLAYLALHPNDEANPVYWAAVTVYGDMRPVDLAGGWWGLLLLAALVLVAGYLGYRYKRSLS